MKTRERFSSRLGFILISAGCAIGLGNVWRFPYITGRYGGAAFVLIYLIFLVILGLPIMIMEFSVGRASRASVATSFQKLEPKGSKWHLFSYLAMGGNYILMMFYTAVGGWMLAYFFKTASGDFRGLTPDQIGGVFSDMLARPGYMIFWMIVTVVISFAVCYIGLQKGVERITKVMMVFLLLIMGVLCIRSITLPGAAEGIVFYLKPDFGRMIEAGLGEAVFAALGQAFFTLSIGIGSLAIFGSYIGKERSLTGEAVRIAALDTFVALMAGLIIFPACFAFNVDQTQGPGLVFVTLPNVFSQMPGGQLWGSLFFAFLSFAALSTVIAVFENIISFAMDLWGFSRQKAVLINLVAIILLSIPCILGFNVWSGWQPLGAGSTIQDLEDFILSNNIILIGSLTYLGFCVSKKGWGWNNFLAEANCGEGAKFPKWTKIYIQYGLPLIIIMIFVVGYIQKFFAK